MAAAAKRYRTRALGTRCVLANDVSAAIRVGEIPVNLLDVASVPERGPGERDGAGAR